VSLSVRCPCLCGVPLRAQYIEFTAAKGNVHAMRMMGRFLYWGARGMPRDHTRALSYFRRAAELGDVHSMLTLGRCWRGAWVRLRATRTPSRP